MRLRLPGREQPPVQVRSSLAPTDRVLSWADAADGAVVAATRLGLWWPFAEGPRSVGWQFVTKATWRDGVLTLVEADVVDDVLLVDRPPVAVSLTVPRDLPPTVRARVEQNIVRRELAAVAGGTVRFVARRQPGMDGLTWWAHLEAGTPWTADVRAAVTARVRRLRSETAAADR